MTAADGHEQIEEYIPPFNGPQRPRASIAVILSLSTVSILVGAFWTIHSSQIAAAAQIGESVPPIPAFATLVLLTVVAAGLRRWAPAWAPSRTELLITYYVVFLGVYFTSLGGVEYLFDYLTGPFYYHTEENRMQTIWQYIPGWVVPHDTEAIRQMYEKSEDGSVPWRIWLVPLTVWLLFFVAFFWTTLCIFSLLRPRWGDEERLSFPLVQLALRLTEEGTPQRKPFFLDRFMWIAFALALVFNITNAIHAVDPTFPALWKGSRVSIGRGFWQPLQLYMRYDPLALGLGYLMSLEMLFSVWFCFVFTRLEAVALNWLGYPLPGWTVTTSQGIGAFLAMFAIILYAARRQLVTAAKALVLWDTPQHGEDELLPARVASIGGIVGLALLCGFCMLLGMNWWLALLLMGLALVIAIVYARGRAQAGAPYVWLLPLYQLTHGIPKLIGTKSILAAGGPAALTMLAYFGFVARSYVLSFPAAQMEAAQIAGTTGFRRRRMAALLMFAVVLGLIAAYYFHLSAYYRHGNVSLATVKNPGTLRLMASTLDSPPDASTQYRAFTAAGFSTTLLIGVIRHYVSFFRIHPLGFAIACTYADPLWFPFFVAWLSKLLILRFGGVKTYQRMVPFFLGLVFGHFVAGGIVWSLLRTFGGEFFRSIRYGVIFG